MRVAVALLIGIVVFLCLVIPTIYFGLVLNPAYEDSCIKLMTSDFGYEITDHQYVNNVISCQNYFDGHPIAEYWSGYIALIIFWAVIVIIVSGMIIAFNNI